MDVAFNSIAILFIMDVDNLSYQFLLGERAKERVDAMGHVNLNRDQARALSLTKVLCSVVAIVGTLYMVTNGASVGAMLAGGVVDIGGNRPVPPSISSGDVRHSMHSVSVELLL